MESYHPIKLGLSRAQLMKLANGQRVQVSPHHVGSGTTHFLTKSQLRKLKTAVTKGKGIRLHFSHHQIRHHLVHGTGLWDSIKAGLSKVWDIAKKPLGNLAKKGVEKVAEKYLPPGVARDIANKVGEAAINKVTGGRIMTIGHGFHTFGRGSYV